MTTILFIVALAGCAACFAVSSMPVRKRPSGTWEGWRVEEPRSIVRVDERYFSFPALTCLNNGDVLLAFRDGRNCFRDYPDELIDGVYHSHYDWQSEPRLMRSTDGGRTWHWEKPPPRSQSEFEQDHANGIGYQDVGLTRLPDGRVVMTVFRWQFTHERPRVDPTVPVQRFEPTPFQRFQYAYNLPPVYSVSDVEGRRWSPFKVIDLPDPDTGGPWRLTTRNGGVMLDGATVGWPFSVATQTVDQAQSSSYMLKYHVRTDRWEFGSTIAAGSHELPMEEPLIHRASDGRLLGFYRCSPVGYTFANFSEDNGVTWSPPARTGIWGFPYAALNLDGGDVLLVYGYRRAPFGMRMAQLKDGRAETFDPADEFVLRDDGLNEDIGYPSLAVMPDRTVLLAYYYMTHNDPDRRTRYVVVDRLRTDRLASEALP